MKRNGCHGNSVGLMTDRSGNFEDFTQSDSYDNDDARSLRLDRVSAGTLITVYDNSRGRRNDDFSEILVRSTTNAQQCVSTFEFANGTLSNATLQGRYRDFGNLDGKVSRVEVKTAILSRGGRCVDVNANNGSIQLFPCHMGANQSWVYGEDGTIRSPAGLCLEARQSDIDSSRPNSRRARLRIATCTGGANQLWSRTRNQEIRMFSEMCMDIVNGSDVDHAPIQIYPCHGGINQKWLASF
jgi:hypothetical protein